MSRQATDLGPSQKTYIRPRQIVRRGTRGPPSSRQSRVNLGRQELRLEIPAACGVQVLRAVIDAETCASSAAPARCDGRRRSESLTRRARLPALCTSVLVRGPYDYHWPAVQAKWAVRIAGQRAELRETYGAHARRGMLTFVASPKAAPLRVAARICYWLSRDCRVQSSISAVWDVKSAARRARPCSVHDFRSVLACGTSCIVRRLWRRWAAGKGRRCRCCECRAQSKRGRRWLQLFDASSARCPGAAARLPNDVALFALSLSSVSARVRRRSSRKGSLELWFPGGIFRNFCKTAGLKLIITRALRAFYLGLAGDHPQPV